MKSEFREIEVFIASDGEEFLDDSSCYMHEQKIALDKWLYQNPIVCLDQFREFYREYRGLIDLPKPEEF